MDRTNLGEQAEKEFQAYRAPGVIFAREDSQAGDIVKIVRYELGRTAFCQKTS